MNNPFTSALGSIGQNFNGLITGTNPLFAPQAASLFGFNIPAVPIISVRDYFLVQMESWFTAIPPSSQWIVVIDRYPYALNTRILQGLERTDGSKKGWDVSIAKTILTSYPLQKVIGCLFASAATIPPEEYTPESASVQNNRGFVPGILGGARDSSAPTLNIDFRETNTSFVDFVIKPWTILAAHYGMVARPNDKGSKRDKKNVKCNMTLLQYSRTLNSISMIPRKVYNFYNCVPYSVNAYNLEHTDDNLQSINTRWTYSHYTIESALYLPVQDIVNRISNGSIPRITSFQNGIGSINPLGFI